MTVSRQYGESDDEGAGARISAGQARRHGRGVTCANNRWETEAAGTPGEWREMR